MTDVDVDVDAIQAMYSTGAGAYRDTWAPVLLELARVLVDRMALADALRILEVGCGPGLLLPVLGEAAPMAQIVGGDVTADMVALAPAAFDRVVCDVMSMPFPPAIFDVVVIPFMLFHVPSDTAAIAEVARVLRPSGTVGLSVWGARSDPLAYEVWEECFPTEPASGPPCSGHSRMDTSEKVRGLLEGGSFTVEDIWVEQLAHVWRPDDLIRFKLDVFPDKRLGSSETIDPARLRRARERLEALPDGDMTDNCEVIRAIATANKPGR